MRFSRIRLENWRNFGQVDVALQNRAFLVGPNAVGKSNFLDAFRFLRELVTPGGGFQKSVADRGGVSRIRNLAARPPITHVALEVDLMEGDSCIWNYRIAFNQDGQGPVVKEEKVWHHEKGILLKRPSDEDASDEQRLRQTHLEQTIANYSFRAISDFFSDVRYSHIVPQLVRDPDRSVGRQADPYGGDFLEQVARTLARLREVRLRRISKALRVAVPQLAELTLERDDRGTPHLRGKYEHWRARGAWQNEADFSDGTLRLIGLLWALLDGNGPLLLEEPELSLHAEIVRYLPQMMHGVQRERRKATRQVLLSTHSSDLLQDQGIAADEIILFKPSKQGSEVRVGAEIKEIVDLLFVGLTAAEAVLPYTKPADAKQLVFFGESDGTN